MTIVNDDSRVINKLEASLTDDARVVIYDCHRFIVQATVRGYVYSIQGIPKKNAESKSDFGWTAKCDPIDYKDANSFGFT